jgi:uncharacterized protein (UPF0335 family)
MSTIPGDNSRHELLRHVEAIERLAEEKQGLSDDIKERFAQAKADGFDAKIMRKVLARRRRDADELREEDQMIETYITAIDEAELSERGRSEDDGA